VFMCGEVQMSVDYGIHRFLIPLKCVPA